MDADELSAALPPSLPLTELLLALQSGGRPAVLQALRDAGVSSLPQRQKLATATARAQRSVTEPAVERPLAPQPTNEPLAVRAEAGLCNKLRCILSYREVAHDEGRHLYVLWTGGGACPASWDELFEPLEGVTIFHDESTALAEALYKMEQHIGAVPSEFGTHPAIAGTAREASMYLQLRPRPAILRAIAETILRCRGPEGDGAFVATHIRRTDFAMLFGLSVADHDFERFVNRHCAEPASGGASSGVHARRAYIATDNAVTQQHFRSQFPAAFCCHCEIRPHAPPANSGDASRHTPVSDAVVDLFACAAASVFKGTLGSSFSDTIWLLRRARGVAHDLDELQDAASFQRRVGSHASTKTGHLPGYGLSIRLPLPPPLLQAMAAHQLGATAAPMGAAVAAEALATLATAGFPATKPLVT